MVHSPHIKTCDFILNEWAGVIDSGAAVDYNENKFNSDVSNGAYQAMKPLSMLKDSGFFASDAGSRQRR